MKAWCDPDAPQDQEPYVWQFARDGKSGRRRAPKKIFFESELYTLSSSDGLRDLSVEHSLAELESRFVAIREQKLLLDRALTPEEHVDVCAFIAVMHSRTPSQIDHHRSNWERAAEMGRRVRAAMDAGKSVPSLGIQTGPSLSLEQVEELANAQRGDFVWPLVANQLPVLCDMNLSVLATEDPIGFITSDAPCVWFDPQAYLRPLHMQSPGLGYKTIEIGLPSSPNQMLVLSWLLRPGRIQINDQLLDELNRRTRFYAQDHFVVRCNVVRSEWFTVRTPPTSS